MNTPSPQEHADALRKLTGSIKVTLTEEHRDTSGNPVHASTVVSEAAPPQNETNRNPKTIEIMKYKIIPLSRHSLTINDRKAISMALPSVTGQLSGVGVQLGHSKYSIRRDGDSTSTRFVMEKQWPTGEQVAVPFTIEEETDPKPVVHTPGPWHCHLGRGANPRFHIQTEGGYQIASTPELVRHAQAFEENAQKEANARLLAAAPELLAALRLFVEPATVHEVCERENIARAVIAAATEGTTK